MIIEIWYKLLVPTPERMCYTLEKCATKPTGPDFTCEMGPPCFVSCIHHEHSAFALRRWVPSSAVEQDTPEHLPGDRGVVVSAWKATIIEPVFVFGSNLAGRHGKGAALAAVKEHGAHYGKGVGPTGNAYAIPTKDAQLNPLPLGTIRAHIDSFLAFATNNPQELFTCTRVGCGLAGYTEAQIRPMFEYAPDNVAFTWRDLAER